MINIKPDVFGALVSGCPSADVSDEFPKEWKKSPKITYTEEQNEVYEWTDDEEKTARIVYRIDLWDKTNTSTVAGQVDAVMASLGFLRTMSMDSPVKELYKHKLMRYEALICADDEHVYHE